MTGAEIANFLWGQILVWRKKDVERDMLRILICRDDYLTFRHYLRDLSAGYNLQEFNSFEGVELVHVIDDMKPTVVCLPSI